MMVAAPGAPGLVASPYWLVVDPSPPDSLRLRLARLMRKVETRVAMVCVAATTTE